MTEPINIKIYGVPVSWGCKENTWEWRRNIKNKIKEDLKGKIIEKVKNGTKFKVKIIFGMFEEKKADLDNLAKPILDTIFKCYRPQSKAKEENLYGVMFDVDDNRVFKLILEKCKVKSKCDEGVEISIDLFE